MAAPCLVGLSHPRHRRRQGVDPAPPARVTDEGASPPLSARPFPRLLRCHRREKLRHQGRPDHHGNSLLSDPRRASRKDHSSASYAVAAVRSCASKAGQTTAATFHGQIRAGQATTGEGRGEPERGTKRRGEGAGETRRHRGMAVGGGGGKEGS
ncbi:hypothetical protein D1007_17135 [Hordeum vulgare]|nr:hypothetical protein D1007_17135 [Hordeum vulgare]